MGDTAWLGMDVSMDKIYAQQFDFIRNLISKCGAEFLQIHEHLARHDLFGEQIVALQLQARVSHNGISLYSIPFPVTLAQRALPGPGAIRF